MDHPLGKEKLSKLIIQYSIPSIISFVVNSLYNMVDQVFIGQGVGYLGNAATNVIMPLTTIMLALGLMIGDGAAAFMSLNLGQGNKKEARKSVGNMCVLTLIAGILLMIVFELFLRPLALLFGATETVMPWALNYGRIIVLEFPFYTVSIAFASIIRADGRPNETMRGLLIGCITNIILDPVFIFIFKMGVQGAALATIIEQFLNAVYFVVCIFRFKTFELKAEDIKLDRKISTKIITLGTSSFITQIAVVLVIGVMNNLLVNYGGQSKYGADIPLATFGITMFTSVAVMLLALVIFQIFPHNITALFGQESDLYMEFAVKSFRIFLLACFLQLVASVAGIFFQSIGKPVLSAVCSMSRQIVFMIPSMILLGKISGIEGILWAGPVADTFSAVIAGAMLVLFWKKIFKEKL